MISRLDPVGWSDRLQMAVLAGGTLGWALGTAVWPPLAGLVPVVMPLTGALIWRFEGTRTRDIASWTVPLAIVLYLGGMLSEPIGLFVSLAGMGVLVAMMFSNTARDGWLRLVAPGQYRVFRGADRPIADRIAVLDHDARQALGRFTRTGDSEWLVRRLEKLVEDAGTMEIGDAAWRRLRDLFVAWLRASAKTVEVERDEFQSAFADMTGRRAAFEEAKTALADERSSPLGGSHQAGPPK